MNVFLFGFGNYYKTDINFVVFRLSCKQVSASLADITKLDIDMDKYDLNTVKTSVYSSLL